MEPSAEHRAPVQQVSCCGNGCAFAVVSAVVGLVAAGIALAWGGSFWPTFRLVFLSLLALWALSWVGAIVFHLLRSRDG